VALGMAVKAALTAKALPLSTHGQGHDLAPAERALRPRMSRREPGGRATIVSHDIKHRQAGVPIDQRICSLSWGR
jgi:hypothetical protein